MRLYHLLLLLPLSSSFVLQQQRRSSKTSTVLFEGDREEEEDKGLVLGDLDTEMRKVSSDMSFGAIDYLAEARKRAEQRTESDNSGGGDKEWKELANEKADKYGTVDDWENSVKEAGNADSQILMFTEPAQGEGEDGEEGEEPKLLLF